MIGDTCEVDRVAELSLEIAQLREVIRQHATSYGLECAKNNELQVQIERYERAFAKQGEWIKEAETAMDEAKVFLDGLTFDKYTAEHAREIVNSFRDLTDLLAE